MTVFNALTTAGKALAVLKVTEKVTERVTEMADERPQNDQQQETGTHTIFEEIEVEGRQLVERVRELIHEGNVRTLRVKDRDGKYLLEIPLSVGVVAGGVFALTAPWTIALSALAGIVLDVKIEVIREVDDDPKE